MEESQKENWKLIPVFSSIKQAPIRISKRELKVVPIPIPTNLGILLESQKENWKLLKLLLVLLMLTQRISKRELKVKWLSAKHLQDIWYLNLKKRIESTPTIVTAPDISHLPESQKENWKCMIKYKLTLISFSCRISKRELKVL